MPLYEYECDSCGERLETIQRFADPPLTECPECAGALRRLVSAPAFQFKGSGWYVTDYAGKGSPPGGDKAEKTEKTEKTEKKGAEAKTGSDSGGDAKPAPAKKAASGESS